MCVRSSYCDDDLGVGEGSKVPDGYATVQLRDGKRLIVKDSAEPDIQYFEKLFIEIADAET